jgi:hypothetical protein
MNPSDEMRRLIDLANNNKLSESQYGSEEQTSEAPFKSFAKWGLKEGAKPEADASDDDEEAKEDVLEPKAKVLDEAGEPWAGMASDYHLSHEFADHNEHVMHLLRPRGGSECGAACGEDDSSPEINDVTCPECLAGHEEYLKKYDREHEGHDGELEEEDHLDRMFAHHMAGHDDYFGQYDMFKGVNEDDEEYADIPCPISQPRAREILNTYNDEAHGWGDMEKFMTPEEVHWVRQEFMRDDRPNRSFADVIRALAHGTDPILRWMDQNKTGANEELDEENPTGSPNREVEEITAPSHWASYLINGDDSGMEPEEVAACNEWQDKIKPWYVVSTTDEEPRFTWSYKLYGGTAAGGEVMDYVCYKENTPETAAPMEMEEDAPTGGLHVDYVLDIDDLPEECIDDCSTSGSNDDAVDYWRKKLNFTVDRARAIRCLQGYGAWTRSELAASDDDLLANRILWLACHDFNEWDGKEGDSNSGSCQFVLEDEDLEEGQGDMHYEMDQSEFSNAKGGGYIDPSRREGSRDYHPEMLCRTGDGHAKGTRNKDAVTCPKCLSKLGKKPEVEEAEEPVHDETPDEHGELEFTTTLNDLSHAVTRYDRAQMNKRHYNHYALALYLQACDRVIECMKGGMSLKDSISKCFTGSLETSVLRYMKKIGYRSLQEVSEDRFGARLAR